MVCIVCPNGCHLKVSRDGDMIDVQGAKCKRGIAFGTTELTNPTRSLTTTVDTAFPDMPRLPVKTGSFGGIGIFAIPEMGRFYRHVLIQKRYPHHGAVAFGHYGKTLFEVLKFFGIADIAYNQPKSLPYPTENPFA